MKEHFHSSEKKYNQTPTESARGGEPFFNYIGNEGYVREFQWAAYGKYYISLRSTSLPDMYF
jgi:hypothetical protein